MPRKFHFRFERLAVYRAEQKLSRYLARVEQALPEELKDIRDMLDAHSLTVGLKIARGTAELNRSRARHGFLVAARSAELCESILERLALVGLGDPRDLNGALKTVAELQAGLQEISARIARGLPLREVFRDM